MILYTTSPQKNQTKTNWNKNKKPWAEMGTTSMSKDHTRNLSIFVKIFFFSSLFFLLWSKRTKNYVTCPKSHNCEWTGIWTWPSCLQILFSYYWNTLNSIDIMWVNIVYFLEFKMISFAASLHFLILIKTMLYVILYEL